MFTTRTKDRWFRFIPTYDSSVFSSHWEACIEMEMSCWRNFLPSCIGSYQNYKFRCNRWSFFNDIPVLVHPVLTHYPLQNLASSAMRSSICWGCHNVKMASYQYKDSHHKDKTVSWPSYLYHVNPIPGKTVFILKHVTEAGANMTDDHTGTAFSSPFWRN